MIANPPLDKLIYMFNHYTAMAEHCWKIYNDICEAYFMYDYYMEMAEMYEAAILSQLY